MFLYDLGAQTLQTRVVNGIDDLIEFAVLVEISGRFAHRIALIQMRACIQQQQYNFIAFTRRRLLLLLSTCWTIRVDRWRRRRAEMSISGG